MAGLPAQPAVGCTFREGTARCHFKQPRPVALDVGWYRHSDVTLQVTPDVNQDDLSVELPTVRFDYRGDITRLISVLRRARYGAFGKDA
jgi:hypothetical protein